MIVATVTQISRKRQHDTSPRKARFADWFLETPPNASELRHAAGPGGAPPEARGQRQATALSGRPPGCHPSGRPGGISDRGSHPQKGLSGGRGGDPSRRRLKPTGLVPRGSFTQIKICSHPFLCKKNFSSGMNGPGRCTPWPHSLSPAPAPASPHISGVPRAPASQTAY